jgi:DNA-directed RNA polymerase specialized sigma24 family protein
MATKKPQRDEAPASDPVLTELRTTNRLLAILATRGMEQKDAIALLQGMSFSVRSIAAALSITPNNVSVAIHRMKKAEQQPSEKATPSSSDVPEVEQNG